MSMDGSTKRRLLLGFISNWIGKFASVIIQLIQVPVFLHFWITPLYGEWMIVTSIPTYLSFTNVGFGTVAGNEMTMMVARDDREGALRVFQSCWWLISIICTATIVLLSGTLYYLPAARLLKLTHIGESDTKWIIFYLGISVLLSQLEQLLQSAYRSIGRYSYGAFVKTLFSLAAFASTIAAVILGCGPRVTALVFAATNIASTLFFCLMIRHDIPWIEFGWSHASFAEIRQLAPAAIAFMGFPIGNALNLQEACSPSATLSVQSRSSSSASRAPSPVSLCRWSRWSTAPLNPRCPSPSARETTSSPEPCSAAPVSSPSSLPWLSSSPC